ncbi:cysteine desulfurase family protein [Myxococcota bacterium]
MDIYMDHQATTPVDPRVVERMLPFFSEHFGNPASRSHVFGWKAEAAVEAAREQVAALMGGTAREVVFTSGATESDNLALFGVAEAYARVGDHIITQATEHKAVLDPCKVLETKGKKVTILPVTEHGRVDPDHVREAMTEGTILVSIMLANNEIGTIQPIEEIGKICRARGVLLHCDAAQGLGGIPFDVDQMRVDLASVSSHKMYGPKGIGALFIRRKSPRARVAPIIYGGGHERGLRSGTLNVPAIVGFGEAARILSREGQSEASQIRALRDHLLQEIVGQLDGVHVNGHPDLRLPGCLSLSFESIEGEALMMSIKDVAISSGSACTSATLEASHVLKACGRGEDLARGTVRFGLGRPNTPEQVEQVAHKVVEGVRKLRAMRG